MNTNLFNIPDGLLNAVNTILETTKKLNRGTLKEYGGDSSTTNSPGTGSSEPPVTGGYGATNNHVPILKKKKNINKIQIKKGPPSVLPNGNKGPLNQTNEEIIDEEHIAPSVLNKGNNTARLYKIAHNHGYDRTASQGRNHFLTHESNKYDVKISHEGWQHRDRATGKVKTGVKAMGLYKHLAAIHGAMKVRPTEFKADKVNFNNKGQNFKEDIDWKKTLGKGTPKLCSNCDKGMHNQYCSGFCGCDCQQKLKKQFCQPKPENSKEEYNMKSFSGFVTDIYEEDLDEVKKPAMPIKSHPYHTKQDNELHYIMKDAHEAMVAGKGVLKPHEEGKYADQLNDAATVLGYRRNGGKRVEVKEETDLEEDKVAVCSVYDKKIFHPVYLCKGATGIRRERKVNDDIHPKHLDNKGIPSSKARIEETELKEAFGTKKAVKERNLSSFNDLNWRPSEKSKKQDLHYCDNCNKGMHKQDCSGGACDCACQDEMLPKPKERLGLHDIKLKEESNMKSFKGFITELEEEIKLEEGRGRPRLNPNDPKWASDEHSGEETNKHIHRQMQIASERKPGEPHHEVAFKGFKTSSGNFVKGITNPVAPHIAQSWLDKHDSLPSHKRLEFYKYSEQSHGHVLRALNKASV
jgi:hypothetical protein